MSRNRNEESSPGPVAPAGFRLAALAEVLTGAALIGGRCSTVGRPRAGSAEKGSAAPGFTHVVRTSAHVGARPGSAEAPSVLDGASHGPAGRWVLLQRVC